MFADACRHLPLAIAMPSGKALLFIEFSHFPSKRLLSFVQIKMNTPGTRQRLDYAISASTIAKLMKRLEYAMSRPLKIYMRGERVSHLQQLLKRLGHEITDQSGLFGASTRAAVKLLQQEKGLEATGIVDDALMTMIGGNLSPKPDTAPHASNTTPELATLQAQVDALTQLLLQKGVITADELSALLPPPASAPEEESSNPPSSKAAGVSGSPLF